MQPSPFRSVLGTLRRLADAGGANDLSDADLLERFRARHEEAAFTLLVQRHGPMVLPHKFLAIWDLTFSPDSARLAAGGMELHRPAPGRVQVWEVPSWKSLVTFDTHTQAVKRVAFSPDGRTLATGGMDGTLRLWEVAAGKERRRFQGHEGVIAGLAFAPDGRSLAAASADAPVFVWDVAGTSRPPRKHSAD
jgi:WD40 repeat protein